MLVIALVSILLDANHPKVDSFPNIFGSDTSLSEDFFESTEKN